MTNVEVSLFLHKQLEKLRAMQETLQEISISKLAEKISRDEHLEELFLTYILINSSIKDLRNYHISIETKNSLLLFKQATLDTFLVEADKRYSIQQLNGEIPELIACITQQLNKSYNLEEYFEL